MVQGDEPMTHPDMITEAVTPMLDDPNIQIVNLFSEIKSIKEFNDRNCIKVVMDQESNAIYFSREPIPTQSKMNKISKNKQVCIIPFRRDFLKQYTDLNPTPLEIAESVDMMRVIEYGLKVRMVPTKFNTHAVDTENDLHKVSKYMKQLI